MSKQATVYAITNQKGGIGKSTTAVSLLSGLKRAGKRVLLVDADPQCNSSDTLRAQIHDIETLYDVLVEGCAGKVAIQHTPEGDIIPGDPLLAHADSKLPAVGRHNLLRNVIRELAGEYDYIIIDTPPTFGPMLNNALVAATYAIVPVTSERYALAGLSELARTVELVRRNTVNENLRIAGLLLVKTDARRQLTKETMELLPAICQQMQTKSYRTTIREAEAVRKSQKNRESLFAYEDHAGHLAVADDYRAFIQEILEEENHG